MIVAVFPRKDYSKSNKNIILEFKMKKIKVLFVCMGNICRSPTAEGVFTLLVKEKNLHDFFEIDSV